MSEVCRYLITQVCVLCLVAIENSLSDAITIENKTCSMSLHLNEKASETLEWDGRPLLKHCRVIFNVPFEHRYTFIINVEQYKVEVCHFQLLYFDGLNAAPRKNYSCSSSPKQHRIIHENRIYIQFETHGKSRSKVKLKVSAEKLDPTSSGIDSEETDDAALGSLVFVIVAVIFIIAALHKRGINVCELIWSILKCCGQCVLDAVEYCFNGIGEQLSRCCDCSDCICTRTSDPVNATVTEQPTPHQSQANDSESQHSSRTSLDYISLTVTTPEEPSAPPLSEPTSPDDPPPPYECPPPPYLAVVKYIPPPPYLT